MFGPLPRSFFLTCGKGDASTELTSFDAALLDAGIGDTNLIRMSSILPPAAVHVDRRVFPKGSFVPLAYAERASSEPGTVISAAVAVGIPEDSLAAGVIMEHSCVGELEACEKRARDMVRESMEALRGLKIKEIKSIGISHRVLRVGTVFAAVALCP
ncbi:MAG: arginine decarboxylase, pyruvoyl-dependent [Deltaproteobacteria bacterium]|nr:arginine decarboxylase, pyruvoyl-dependent [Deltaproteobacteria bacterium]